MARSRAGNYAKLAGFLLACLAAIVLVVTLVASELLSSFGDFSSG